MKSTQAAPLEAQLAKATKQFISCVAGLTSHFATIANAMANENSREQLAYNRKNTIVEEFYKLGLPMTDFFNANNTLSNEEVKLNIFSQLPMDAKYPYTINILYPRNC